MSTQSTPIPLVVAGVAGVSFDWQGGYGSLIVSALSGTPDFQCSVDNGASWVSIANLGSGALLTAIAAGGAYPFMVGPCRIRMSAGGGAMNVFACRVT